MLKIDNNLLQELGLAGLPEAERNSFLKHIYETLEMRVGIRLADQMSNEQLDEFERYFEAKDDAGAFKWLETNFPNYKEIVQQEFDKLKAEVAQSAPQILAASQAQAGQNAQNPQPQMQPMQPQQPAQQQQYAPQPPQPPAPDQYAQQQPQQFPQQPQAQSMPQQPVQPQYQAPPAPAPQQFQQPQQQPYPNGQPQQFPQQQPPAEPPHQQ